MPPTPFGEHGRLDVLVNNAGIGIPPQELLETSVEDHQRTLDVNLHGVWLGMRACAPLMIAHGGGSIVNISSIDGLAGVARMSSYVASKFAVTGLTKTAALEWGRHGLRVNSVHPGVIASPMVDEAPPAVRERLDAMMARQPITRGWADRRRLHSWCSFSRPTSPRTAPGQSSSSMVGTSPAHGASKRQGPRRGSSVGPRAVPPGLAPRTTTNRKSAPRLHEGGAGSRGVAP